MVFAKSSSSPRTVVIVIADHGLPRRGHILTPGVAIEVAEDGEIDNRSSLKFSVFAVSGYLNIANN